MCACMCITVQGNGLKKKKTSYHISLHPHTDIQHALWYLSSPLTFTHHHYHGNPHQPPFSQFLENKVHSLLPGKLCDVPKERETIWKSFSSHIDTVPVELISMLPLFLGLIPFSLVGLFVLSNVFVSLLPRQWVRGFSSIVCNGSGWSSVEV